MRVYPDVSGLDKSFDYLVPSHLGTLPPGTIVRVPLGARRVRGWVLLSAEVSEHDDLEGLKEILEVVSGGPSKEVLELAHTASARYLGRLRPFLLAASPGRRVPLAPIGSPEPPPASSPVERATVRLIRLAPCASRLSVVEEVVSAVAGQVLVLVPSHADADKLSAGLRAKAVEVARYPEQWEGATGGAKVVVGTRSAVFATLAHLSAVIVLDAHGEVYVEERAPTYSAVVLAEDRSVVAGVPCVLTSPCPTPELTARHHEERSSRLEEAGDWPAIEVIDRRGEDPRAGLYATELGRIVRASLENDPQRRVVLVLNRKGRVRRLACGACGELVTCEHCGAALSEAKAPAAGQARLLSCPHCGALRPKVCASCSSTRLKALRVGVERAAEELEGIVRTPVHLVADKVELPLSARVVIGTEAVLHRLSSASLVVFLDFDQELLAPRFRAGEEALGLVALAGRLVGPRRHHAARRVVIQTRLSGHEVIEAARAGDPDRFLVPEKARRAELGLPPSRALALLSGEEVVDVLRSIEAEAFAVEVLPLGDGRAMVRAEDHATLLDALKRAGVPRLGLRVEVDPLRF